jgi:LmbE family N-acetylglucosaminyl deacetylase
MNTLKKYWWVLGIIIIVVAIGIGSITSRQSVNNNTVTLIISPHFDDAVLSLGGLLAKEKNERVVATFFTATPEQATSTSWDRASGFTTSTTVHDVRERENAAALKKMGNVITRNFNYIDWQYGRSGNDTDLQTEISKDIQTLLVSLGDKKIKVYGPAYFNESITHQDHGLVHKAYIDVARSFPGNNVEFYIYEDFPYVERFNREVVFSLEKNLEQEDDIFVQKVEIPLSRNDVSTKIESLAEYKTQIKAIESTQLDIMAASKRYTENRCGSVAGKSACEVVYKISTY